MFIGKSHAFSFALGVVTAVSVGVAYICLQGSSSLAAAFQPARLSQNAFAASEHQYNSTNTSEIPHIVHQSWINNTVPHRFHAWRNSWVINHPTWEFRLWTDKDNDALVQEHFPWFLSRYRAYEEAVMRADSVRYMYLYRYTRLYSPLHTTNAVAHPLQALVLVALLLTLRQSIPYSGDSFLCADMGACMQTLTLKASSP